MYVKCLDIISFSNRWTIFSHSIEILLFYSSFFVIYIYNCCRKIDLSFILYPAENVGLSLSYGLSLNGVLFWAIYMSCLIENRMVSVERIKQFTVIPSEPAWEIKDRVPPPNWPVHGNIDLKDLQVIGLRLLCLLYCNIPISY